MRGHIWDETIDPHHQSNGRKGSDLREQYYDLLLRERKSLKSDDTLSKEGLPEAGL